MLETHSSSSPMAPYTAWWMCVSSFRQSSTPACGPVMSSSCDSLKSVVMCGCVSAEPSAFGCGVAARRPSGRTRSDSFSMPRRIPLSVAAPIMRTSPEARSFIEYNRNLPHAAGPLPARFAAHPEPRHHRVLARARLRHLVRLRRDPGRAAARIRLEPLGAGGRVLGLHAGARLRQPARRQALRPLPPAAADGRGRRAARRRALDGRHHRLAARALPPVRGVHRARGGAGRLGAGDRAGAARFPGPPRPRARRRQLGRGRGDAARRSARAAADRRLRLAHGVSRAGRDLRGVDRALVALPAAPAGGAPQCAAGGRCARQGAGAGVACRGDSRRAVLADGGDFLLRQPVLADAARAPGGVPRGPGRGVDRRRFGGGRGGRGEHRRQDGRGLALGPHGARTDLFRRHRHHAGGGGRARRARHRAAGLGDLRLRGAAGPGLLGDRRARAGDGERPLQRPALRHHRRPGPDEQRRGQRGRPLDGRGPVRPERQLHAGVPDRGRRRPGVGPLRLARARAARARGGAASAGGGLRLSPPAPPSARAFACSSVSISAARAGPRAALPAPCL